MQGFFLARGSASTGGQCNVDKDLQYAGMPPNDDPLEWNVVGHVVRSQVCKYLHVALFKYIF